MHRHHPDRRTIGGQPPSPFIGRLIGALDVASQVLGQPGRTEVLGLVEDLGDVPQVGDQCLTAGAAEKPGVELALGRQGFEDRRHSLVGQQPGAAGQQRGHRHQVVAAGRRDVGAGPIDQRGHHGPPQVPAVRSLQRLQQHQPVGGGLGGEDA